MTNWRPVLLSELPHFFQRVEVARNRAVEAAPDTRHDGGNSVGKPWRPAIRHQLHVGIALALPRPDAMLAPLDDFGVNVQRADGTRTTTRARRVSAFQRVGTNRRQRQVVAFSRCHALNLT